jgi:ESS family glutamate:Na+ symporter
MHLFAQIADAAAGSSTVFIGPFALLALAIPVLLMGEFIFHRVGWLHRANVPPPIIGGLLVAIVLVVLARFAPGFVTLQGSTANAVWLWPVLPQWGLGAPGLTDVERPLLILFFTCVGFNASWSVARKGGFPLVILLLLSIGLSMVQAGGGALTALALGEHPLLGIMAGNVSLMGGFGTAAGFAPEFEKAGLAGAASIGLAAAAFGVIAGGLVAGGIGGRLVQHKLHRAGKGPAGVTEADATAVEPGGFIAEVKELTGSAKSVLINLAALVVCMKLGAFFSVFIQSSGITFPVYMGSMIVAAILRNVHDLLHGTWLKSERVDAIGSVALMWLLAIVMIDLQLTQLLSSALPLLVILAVQVALIACIAYFVTFRLMGRDYEAAVSSAGMIGYGLGATSNAMATMRVMIRRFGPAPRSMLIVPIVGSFLVDFFNAVLTTAALNILK